MGFYQQGSARSLVVLYSGDDDDTTGWHFKLPHHDGSSTGSGTGSGSGGSTGGASVSGSSGTGLVINVTYDSSVSSAPAGFTDVINQVVQFFETHFSDPITVNINVGYGKIGGSTMSPSALGQSSTYITSLTYSQLTSALSGDSKTAADASAVASLPGSDPTGQTYWVSTAEAKALGLPDPGAPVDGYVGFSSAAGIFDYNNSDGVGAGQYDFFGVVEHEFSEVMGRLLLTGQSISGLTSYSALDLFHFSSSTGLRTFSGSTAGYFSIDNGATSINTFNTAAGGDRGDWAGATYDADNAFGSPGNVAPVSDGDVTVLDVIGWDATSSSPPPPPPPPPPDQPDLTASAFSLNATTSGLSANFQINNVGAADAKVTSTAGVYLSTDTTITTSDTFVGSSSTAALLAGTGAAGSASLTLPTGLAAGTYYLGVYADSSNVISEGSETNNASNVVRIILGNSAGNTLNGTSGSDIIFGQGGNDNLYGGGGVDTMSGGAGADHFQYKATTEGLDQILDFQVGSDSLDFSFSAFGRRLALGGTNRGTLDPSHFALDAPTAHTAQFVYNTGTQTLYFDSDGTGSAPAVAIAHVQFDIGTTLHNTDIHIV